MKVATYCMLFAGLIAVAIAIGSVVHAITPYEIDKDYWFSDSHTIKTNDGWTFHIKEFKRYNISGKVVGIKYYRENHLQFSPVDFCISWGKVIESPHDKWGNYTMLYRGCNHEYQSQNYEIELSSEYIDAHVSNNHLIPSNKDIFDKLMAIKEGDFIEINGFLVSVTGEDKNGAQIPPWISDTKGTFKECEIVLVEDVEVLEIPEEYKGGPNFLEDAKNKNIDEKRDIVFITMTAVMLIILIILILRRK